MCDKKRERSSNFEKSEVTLLAELVAQHKFIIENKKTDAVTNKDKEAAWKSIAEMFNASSTASTPRTAKTLKLKYEGIKKFAKKKVTAHRQEFYRTGGGPSNAPTFDVIEDKVLSICSNISGLDARNDSDNFLAKSIPDASVESKMVLENFDENNGADDVMFEITATLPDHENVVTTPVTKEFTVQDDSQEKENCINDLNCIFNDEMLKDTPKKWASWNPKALKTKVFQALKPSKTSVTNKLDSLSTERLDLVELQNTVFRNQIQHNLKEHQLRVEEQEMQNTLIYNKVQHESKELQMKIEEHQLKMLHLKNEEARKLELHQLMMETMKRK